MGIDPAKLSQGFLRAIHREPAMQPIPALQRPLEAVLSPKPVNEPPHTQKATQGVSFVIPGAPIGKPRMTRRDKWAKRPCVMRYREWADKARACAPELPKAPLEVSWTAYFPFPASYSAKKREALKGQPHQLKSDRDNVDKALLDSLFEQDCTVSDGTLRKRWDDGKGARIEVFVR